MKTSGSVPPGTATARYERIRDLGVKAAQRGQLHRGARLFQGALAIAQAHHDIIDRDRAFCNYSAVLISLGRHEDVLSELREILVRSSEPTNCRLSAYNISRIYEHRKDSKKGLFYARIARDHGRRAADADPDWLVSDHNQMGNLLAAESRFEEASQEYRAALTTELSDGDVRSAVIRHNLGYCCLVLGDHVEGFSLLFRALRVLRYVRSDYLARTHLDLAFGYLEIDRPRRAERHARRGLELAEKLGTDDIAKNALFLLGEAMKLQGDEDEARAFFDRLQTSYADTPFLSDFLLAVDIRQLVNLRA